MEIRPLENAQEQRAAWALLNSCMPYDKFTWTEFERKTLRDPGYRADLMLGAFEGGDMMGAMLAAVRQSAEAARCNLKLFGVLPPYRRRGVATALLGRLEQQARALSASAIEIPGGFLYFFPGLDPRYTPAVAFLIRQGFKRTGESFNMLAQLTERSFDTSQEEQSLAAAGITVRRLALGDQEGVREFMLRAFSHGWLEETLLAYDNTPVTCHVAVVNGVIEGFAACQVCGEGWFGPMGTTALLRGRHIGRVLMYRCFRDLRDLGYKEAVIPWVGPAEFYAKFAFADVYRVFWHYRKPLAQE